MGRKFTSHDGAGICGNLRASSPLPIFGTAILELEVRLSLRIMRERRSGISRALRGSKTRAVKSALES